MNYKKDRGIAGLSVFLSVIVTLFILGLLIALFAIMSGELRASDSLYTTSSSQSVVNETITGLNDTVGDSLTVSTLRNVVCTVTAVKNVTTGSAIPAGNYTATNCLIKGSADSLYLKQNVRVDYTYVYDYDNSGATSIINETATSLTSATDWFDIFIVISAMVVLILLTVIIINAIRGSGLMGGGDAVRKPNSVGTA